MFDVSLDQGYGLFTMLAVAAVAVLLAAMFYRRALGTLNAWQWQSLLGLRIVAILLIVLLLFKPEFSYRKEFEERPALIFLLDRSSSMSISDDATGETRFDRARAQIETWWERLEDDFDLYLIEFAERARTLEGIEALSETKPDGTATSLGRPMIRSTEILDDDGRPVDAEAVIMLSDGIHNTKGEPLAEAGKIKSVVHTVGVGASLRSDLSYRDIQVTGVDCPDRLMLNNRARVTASIEGVGLMGRVVNVVLEEDGRQVAEAELTLDRIEGSQEIALEFLPTSKGRHTYTVRVPVVAEEKIEENNHRSTVAVVEEPGIRVLYIEGTLRAEYGALVDRFLARDPDLEFCALVQTRPNKFRRRDNMEDLSLEAIPTTAEEIDRFNVFIIGDLDASYMSPAQQELFAERVRKGAGLLMLGGYHSLGPGGYADTPLGRILPMRLGSRDVGQVTEPLLPTLTPDGTHHPIFANISGFFPTAQGPAKIEGLPMLNGCTRVEGAQPGATVLATFTGDAEPMPVLAVQPVGRGRTAVFCGDTTRNWQQTPRALGQESPFLRFWGQMVRYLAGRSEAIEPGASITGKPDKAYYEPGETIRITAVVRDPNGEGAGNVRVVAKIVGPTGRPEQVELAAVSGLPTGNYDGTFDPETAGRYEIQFETQLGPDAPKLATDKTTVEVGRANMEFDRLDLDEKMLAQIASATGGRYVHISTADYLIDQFDRTLRKKHVTRKFPSYEWPLLLPCWLLFVTLLTTEWILRKRFQLR